MYPKASSTASASAPNAAATRTGRISGDCSALFHQGIMSVLAVMMLSPRASLTRSTSAIISLMALTRSSGTPRSNTSDTESFLTLNSAVCWLSSRCCLMYSPVFSSMLTEA